VALSMDFRAKVVKAIEGGMSRQRAAARFDIGPATAVRWAKRVETTGEVAPSKMGGDRGSQRIEAHADVVLARIGAQPDMTIKELREKTARWFQRQPADYRDHPLGRVVG
jgi:transposase